MNNRILNQGGSKHSFHILFFISLEPSEIFDSVILLLLLETCTFFDFHNSTLCWVFSHLFGKSVLVSPFILSLNSVYISTASLRSSKLLISLPECRELEGNRVLFPHLCTLSPILYICQELPDSHHRLSTPL